MVATTTQVGSIADELGGDAIDLTVLLKPGIEAHDFEITPAAGAAIERATLILKSGAGLETWLDDAIETIGGGDRVRDLSDGHRAADVGGRRGRPALLDERPECDRDGRERPRRARRGGAGRRPTAIGERADALIGRLEEADREIRALIDEIPDDRRKVVTDHDALGYFIDEYGLEFVGSVFPSLDVSADPSARDIEDAGRPRSASTTCDVIFAESAVNPQLAEAVAAETGATISDDPLYTDSLGPPGSGAETLDGMLLHNARVIHDGLVGT